MSEQKQKEEDGGDTEPGRKHFYFLISGDGGFGQVVSSVGSGSQGLRFDSC